VKRTFALAAVLSLAVALLSATLGNAQTSTARGLTERVTIVVTPKRDRFRPYTFTTRGRIVPPPKSCEVGQIPNPGGNCVPRVCPPGVGNPVYCPVASRPTICSGKVNVRFQKRGSTASSRNVNLRPDCMYRSKVTFTGRPVATRTGTFKVRARCQGNSLLQLNSSATRTVRAG